MQCAYRATLAVGLSVLVTGPASAQQGGRAVTFSLSGRHGLFQVKSVQEELKLTADQVQEIRDVPQSVWDKHEKEYQGTVGEEQAKLELKIIAEIEKRQQVVLNPEQKKRFKEITLQQRGAEAFDEKELQMALSLTDEQKDKIKTINKDAYKKMLEIPLPRIRPAPGAA